MQILNVQLDGIFHFNNYLSVEFQLLTRLLMSSALFLFSTSFFFFILVVAYSSVCECL